MNVFNVVKLCGFLVCIFNCVLILLFAFLNLLVYIVLCVVSWICVMNCMFDTVLLVNLVRLLALRFNCWRSKAKFVGWNGCPSGRLSP